jgi:hypothetical protein
MKLNAYLNIRVLAFKKSPSTCDGSSGTDPRDKNVNFAGGISPNFRAGSLKMNLHTLLGMNTQEADSFFE